MVVVKIARRDCFNTPSYRGTVVFEKDAVGRLGRQICSPLPNQPKVSILRSLLLRFYACFNANILLTYKVSIGLAYGGGDLRTIMNRLHFRRAREIGRRWRCVFVRLPAIQRVHKAFKPQWSTFLVIYSN